MNKIQVLDCTLRDGGYCNNWEFGFSNIKKISQSLVDADIDIIECGFLTNKVEYNPDISRFTSVEELKAVIPSVRNGKLFVVMMNYGEYDLNELPDCNGASIDGIRVAFHKKDLEQSLEVCKEIKDKGYKVFVQAMVSLSYTDEEFLSLIHKVNEIEPYAFYIVDSFGMMKKKNLMRLFYMVENNLKDNIRIGFHSHNNMQLAYSNAQNLVETQTRRDLIIDSSVYGMGRGAGNLNTELFVDYLNDTVGASYDTKPLLNVIDEVLNDFYQRNYWGYSLPNYLSAAHWIHPNYAGYLSDRNTLTVEAIDEIFSMMSEDKKYEFDKKYIEDLYLKYMESGKAQEGHKTEFAQRLNGKEVLLIAPGRSSEEEKDKIISFVKGKDIVTISVNFDYSHFDTDYIFASNLRRFRDLSDEQKRKCIITSNILSTDVYLKTKYYDLLNSVEAVRDNAGLMAMRFLINLGVKKIYLAGFDGYSYDIRQNYAVESMTFYTRKAVIDEMNEGMSKVLSELKTQIDIEFLTRKRFIR